MALKGKTQKPLQGRGRFLGSPSLKHAVSYRRLVMRNAPAAIIAIAKSVKRNGPVEA